MPNSTPQARKTTLPARKITRRTFLRGGARVSAVALGAAGWGHFVEAGWVEVVQQELFLPRLPRAFDGFRLAQISDIHIEEGSMRHHLPSIIQLVMAQKADAIVLTGDFLTYPDTWQSEPLFQSLQRLRAPHGVFAVLGNHDQWFDKRTLTSGAALVRSVCARAGIHELPNTALPLESEGAKMWIAGLDDWGTSHARLDLVLDALPEKGSAILLQHQPDCVPHIARTHRFDLMLAGHSHGGQIALPFFGPIHVPLGGRNHPRGLYEVGDLLLYTNRGLGTVDIPIRICARPEITVFTLRSGQKNRAKLLP